MKKTIAVIGAEGSLGSAMAYGFAKAGYRTLVTDQNQEDLQSLIGKLPLLVGKIGVKVPKADVGIVVSPREASWEADIIVPAIPYLAQATVASEINDVVTGKIVISVVNPLNATLDRLLTPPSTSAAEELARLLPHSMVVKAFNTVFAMDFETSHTTKQPADVFVAGDDDESVAQVMELVKATGFNPLLAGKLAMSRTLESMMLLLANLSIRNNYNSLAGWKVLQRATYTRD